MSRPTAYPHDLYRRFKEDEYLALDERVQKVEQARGKRFQLAKKGIYDRKEKDENVVDKQLLENNADLEKLHRLGNALITNIRIACEQRQLEEREREKVCNEDMLEKIRQKSVEMEEKLVTIYNRYDKLKSRLDDDPMKFMKTLKILSKQIEELIKSKDDVIQIIKNDLSRIAESYNDVLEKQDYDLHYCMQRVNNYLNGMKQSYLRHILALDDAINKHHHEEYARTYKCPHEFSNEIVISVDTSDMLDNLDMKFKAECDHRKALQSKFDELRIQHDEMTHSIRMQMEQDKEAIEMELEDITAKYFLNSLKFNYNYQVLEKKDSDNVNKIAYEQKNKHFLKSLNCVTNLRKEIKEMKSMIDSESQSITDETEKFRDRIAKLKVKANNGAQVNETKFQTILKMNLEDAKTLIKQIFECNKLFFEEHLGIRWEQSDLKILNHSGLEALQKNFSTKLKASRNYNDERSTECLSIKDIRKDSDEWKTLQLILKKMPGGMSHLIDKDLSGLLELSGKSENKGKLAKLDNIFLALNISNLKDLSTLLSKFQLFVYCPNCKEEKIIDLHKDEEIEIITNSTESSDDYAVNTSSFRPNFEKLNPGNVSIDLDLMEHIENFNKIETKFDIEPKNICPNHCMDINSTYIVSALKLTIKALKEEKLEKIETNEKSNQKTNSSIDHELRKNQIEVLWKRYGTVFPDEHFRLWCSLEHELADYLMHLKKRFQLHSECELLRKQNAQLKYMVQELL